MTECLLDESGQLIKDRSQMDEQILKTMKEIQVDDKWGWIQKKAFPKLNRLNITDISDILDLLSNNKAIAYDGVTDSLFRKERKLVTRKDKMCPPSFLYKETCQKLRNLWRCELDCFLTAEDTWAGRLVPLNKVFPNTPTRFELRPIMIQSPLVKLLEARFLPKLQLYLIEKLGCEQIGFIPVMGIQVNLYRALQQIIKRTREKRVVFGLFIDFSNAYNSVPHTLLFEKLRKYKVLEDDEIDFLEQLYCRYHIKIGDHLFRPNKGVAQGSVISPALFDIFISDLAQELKDKAGVNLEDIMMYADDVLTLCTSLEQLRICIVIIEEWAKRNGMDLNKQKSGIIPFAHRNALKIPLMKVERKVELRNRKIKKAQNQGEKVKLTHRNWIPSTSHFKGIPVCQKYKYLGTWLTPKLNIGPQLGHIKKKSAHLFIKLYPYLATASADGSRDMFNTMVMPLFNATSMLLAYEPSKAHEDKLIRTRRKIFKQFMKISERTNTILVEDMIRINMMTLAEEERRVAEDKWNARKKGMLSFSHLSRRENNPLRGVPNIWCDLINTQVKPCPICKKKGVVTNRWHLKYHHQISLPHINKIWREQICPITEIRYKEVTNKWGQTEVKKIKRREIAEKIQNIVKQHLLDYNQKVGKHLEQVYDIEQEVSPNRHQNMVKYV